MVNTNNILIERNKELLAKIEELENRIKTEISREAQLEIIGKIEKWKKENYEVGERLKKYEGNTYPYYITNNLKEDRPIWKSLAGHVNSELLLVQYLDKKEEPLNELLEMMLNSITRNVIGIYNSEGLKEKERKEWEQKEAKLEGKITRLIKETFPYDKLKEKPLKWNERLGVERGYLDTINGIDHSDFIINFYKEREEEFENFIEESKTKQKELEVRVGELEENLEIEKENAKVHYEAIEVCDNWYTKQPGCLKEKLEESTEMLEKSRDTVENQRAKIEDLEKEKKEISELLEEARKTIEKNRIEREEELNRKNKSRIKHLGKKIKTNFQQLVKKAKSQSQELIARIEIKVK